MRSKAFATGALVLTALLVACGGSGGDGSSASQLTGTQGNAAAYLGTWRSDCGSFLEGANMRGVKVVLEVTSAAGSVASARMTTSVYVETASCTNGSAPLTTSVSNVTLTVDAAAVSVTGAYAGTADKVTLSAVGSAPSIAYFGFVRDMGGFYTSASGNFSNLSLFYKKGAQ